MTIPGGALLPHQPLQATSDLEARELIEAATRTAAGVPVVSVIRDDLSLDEARVIARAIVDAGAIAVVGVRGDRAQVIMGRADGVDLDSGRVIREVSGPLGGKGGGTAQMAQGGVPDPARLAEAVDALVQRVA